MVTEVGSTYANKIVARVDEKTVGGPTLIAKSFLSAERIPKDERSHWGPDASYVKIDIALHGKQIRLESWHPLYESNGRLVATAGGLEALDGRKLEDVIKEQPKSYQQFRATFDRICSEAKKAAGPGAHP